MEYLPLLGFLLAGYAVIANDSLQTLGTWLNSNKDIKWYWLWAYASVILVGVFIYGQFQGDVAYGRLDKIPYIEPTIWHVLAPLALLLLTRKGIPVSTSFLVLSAFCINVYNGKDVSKEFFRIWCSQL